MSHEVHLSESKYKQTLRAHITITTSLTTGVNLKSACVNTKTPLGFLIREFFFPPKIVWRLNRSLSLQSFTISEAKGNHFISL